MTRARRDMIAISAIALVVAAALIGINGAERLEGWIQSNEGWQVDELLVTLGVTGIAFAVFSFRRWRELVEEQKTARVLRGILPICASCQRMRDDAGSWRRFDEVIREKSEAEFSHGLCPECLQRYEAMVPGANP